MGVNFREVGVGSGAEAVEADAVGCRYLWTCGALPKYSRVNLREECNGGCIEDSWKNQRDVTGSGLRLEEWPVKISEICNPIFNNRRFSEAIGREMRKYIKASSNRILSCADSDVGSDEISYSGHYLFGITYSGPAVIINTFEASGTPGHMTEKLETYLKKGKRINISSPLQEESPNKVIPPSKGPEMERDAEKEQGGDDHVLQEAALRIFTERDVKYVDKLRELKKRVKIDVIGIIGIKKYRNNEDIIIRIRNFSEAEILTKRIKDAYFNLEVLADIKKRLYIQNLEASVEDIELRPSIREYASIDMKKVGRWLGLGNFRNIVGCYRCASRDHRAVDCPSDATKCCYGCGNFEHLITNCKGEESVGDRINEVRGYVPQKTYLADEHGSPRGPDGRNGEPVNRNKYTRKYMSREGLGTPLRREVVNVTERTGYKISKVMNKEKKSLLKDNSVEVGRPRKQGGRIVRGVGIQVDQVKQMEDREKDWRKGNNNYGGHEEMWSQVVRRNTRNKQKELGKTPRVVVKIK
ncbi:unnamed protein product [Xylocopa violacea]|uniref:CCHC-type domain-containing protein n=1 Tax=Xylocopa violacea TaxID=135666 RepID=A0ABP1N8K7_XYLVO